jgi:hypothetical protein
MNNDAVQAWLRVRRQLLDMEAAFTALAIRVACGEDSAELLQQEREALEGTRELCSAAYQRAFPAQSPQSS